MCVHVCMHVRPCVCMCVCGHPELLLVPSSSQSSLKVHPLMYLTPWFMCLFTSLPSWTTAMALFEAVLREGRAALFRAGLTLMEVMGCE